jgi:hypothetical protein
MRARCCSRFVRNRRALIVAELVLQYHRVSTVLDLPDGSL